jgi:hypothetical protein
MHGHRFSQVTQKKREFLHMDATNTQSVAPGDSFVD